MALQNANLEAAEVKVLSEEDADAGEAENYRPHGCKTASGGGCRTPQCRQIHLINKILGEDRLLTGPEAGITRDAISLQINWNGTPMRVFDTAGMRKKAKVQEKLEKLSVSDGLRAVKFAEVVVVLLDAAIPFEQQDLRIADLAEREGRAVIVAVNKWDVEEHKQEKLKGLIEAFERLLPQLRGAPLVTVSAKTGRGLDRSKDSIMRAHMIWNRRVSTARLNRWLTGMQGPYQPCRAAHQIALYDASQNTPPGFVVMCSNPEKLPEKLFPIPYQWVTG